MKKLLILLFIVNQACMRQNGTQEMSDPGKEIPVLAWYSIPPGETTLARYKELKETGITYSLSTFPDVESMSSALDTAQKAGIKLIVSCPELKSNTEETVRRFMSHQAVAGYMLRDEPNRSDFNDLGEWAKKIESVDDKHFCYLNLFPNYASEEQLGTKTYKEYVDLFIKEVPLKFLSFDHYPVIGDSLRYNWYENLEIISDAARRAEIPFWAFSLSVAHGPYPIPTIAQLRLQVYSDLAYGAQGIQYFTYWTPYDTAWMFNNGPISLEGKRTIVYDRIKSMNNEIKNLSEVFHGAKVVSVAHTGNKIPAGTKQLMELPKQIKTLKTEGIGAVVSVLKNGEYSYLVIVNRDFIKSMKLSIECSPKVEKVFKDGSVSPADTYQRDIEIDPGDAAIYKWKE